MTISNTDDIIDSRDVIERIEELREQLQDEFNELRDNDENFAEEYDEDAFDGWLAGCDDPDADELRSLEALRDEAEPYAEDWEYGAVLISRDYWVEYVEQFIKDCGYISNDLPGFIYNNINWQGVADEVEQDYTTVEFDGQEYLVR